MRDNASREEENVYLHYRKEAAIDLPALSSREGAAELLGISPESLRDYERG